MDVQHGREVVELATKFDLIIMNERIAFSTGRLGKQREVLKTQNKVKVHTYIIDYVL